ncbi:AMIN-like domain-containing (lipo)protein [Nocardia jiangsuensis]|uniref:AMIN-like domain-containing protein n=1 Tax=Nocardia jiangsuensis TaxID=1691563 RepID=A0ABV8DL87_9NOCA
MRTPMLLTVLAVAAVLTGCDDSGSAELAPSPGSVSTALDAPAPTAAPEPVPADAQPKRGDKSRGAMLTVTGVRIGHHPGFERVVYDLGGTGTPGWVVEYTDRAVQDGSGTVLDLDADSVLEVRILGSAYPFDTGVIPFDNSEPVRDPQAPGVTGVYRTIVFEGETQSFIGVRGDRPPFEVRTANNPTRLIVDIATP